MMFREFVDQDVPDPTLGDDGSCPSLVRAWACTREEGHHGLHVAGTGRHVAAMWNDDRATDQDVAVAS